MQEYRSAVQNAQYADEITGVMTEEIEYETKYAIVYAHVMTQIRDRASGILMSHGTQHVVTYSLKKGLEKFGERGRQATLKEMQQLHDRECFKPIDVKTLTESERK